MPTFFWYTEYNMQRHNNWSILSIIIGLFERRNKEKVPSFDNEKVLFHYDNTSAHISSITIEKLDKLRYELFSHSPYKKWQI